MAKIDFYSEDEGLYKCELKGSDHATPAVALSGSINNIIQATYYLDKACIKIKK